jgi:hypothetical protein
LTEAIDRRRALEILDAAHCQINVVTHKFTPVVAVIPWQAIGAHDNTQRATACRLSVDQPGNAGRDARHHGNAGDGDA